MYHVNRGSRFVKTWGYALRASTPQVAGQACHAKPEGRLISPASFYRTTQGTLRLLI